MPPTSSSLPRTRIRFRMLINFGLLFTLVLGTLAVTWLTLNHLQSQAQRIIDQYEPQVNRVSQVELLMIRISLEARHAMLAAGDAAESEATLQRIGQFRQQKLQLLDEIDQNLSTAQGRAILAQIRAADQDFWRLAGQTVGLIQNGDVPGAFALLKTDLVTARNRQLDHIATQKEWQRQLMNQALTDASRVAFQVKIGLSVFVGVMLIIIGLSISHLMRVMQGAFSRAQTVISQVANGRAGSSMNQGNNGDESGSLFSAISDMDHRLLHVVRELGGASSHIVQAVASLDRTNESLKNAATHQMSAIDQSVEGTRRMVEAVSASVQATDAVNRLVVQASEVATQSGQAVTQVVGEMEQINESSRKISEIVGVIDSIAFQTNILALNAAVEAARAGEQGRGFAVVAAEVRSLAQRSANAAKEVKTLIDNSTQRVRSGSEAAGHAGNTVQLVLRSVEELAERMRDIALATQQQSEAASSMQASVAQVSEMARTNVELVEQSYATSAGLSQQAHTLDGAIAAFNLDTNASDRVEPAHHAPRHLAAT